MTASTGGGEGTVLDSPRTVILAAAEAQPFAKLGGLGDVTTALAGALADLGLQVTVLLPAYGHIRRQEYALQTVAESLPVRMGPRLEHCGLLRGPLPGTTAQVALLDHPGYFGRPGVYTDPDTGLEYADSAERWTFFSHAILAALPRLGGAPDVIHLNDHHNALTAALRRYSPHSSRDSLRQTAFVLAIHNLGYQGIYEPRFLPLTGLPETLMQPMGTLEFWGRMNFLKAGLVCADVLTTVSPSYAREIQESEEMGCGLQGVLRNRREDLFGILNGIDTKQWDPEADPLIPAHFAVGEFAGKAKCKAALQERCGLPLEPRVPLFGMVSRLVDQKGVDLVLGALPTILASPLQCILLGRGQPAFEKAFRAAAAAHPRRLALHLDYDETLAHWIEAGADFFLMPSRYEPCGLNQMYSMRYGTVPVVRRTGGLADTVRDWNGLEGTGICFDSYTVGALETAVRRALATYERPWEMDLLRRAGMSQDHSWKRSAEGYLQVYTQALRRLRQGSQVASDGLGH